METIIAKHVNKRLISIVGVIFFLIVLSSLPVIGAWTTVSAGNVGVVTRLGAVNRVENPGFVLKIPLIEAVYKMETRTQLEQVDAQSASKDLQQVQATIALNFHLRGQNAVDVYQNIGIEYKERIIAPAMQEAFKATTARYTASDLIGKREAVKNLAYKELKGRLEKYNIVVDDFNIVNFKFSDEFNQAIEQKTVAQQNKEKAQIEAETALIKAKGQVNAQRALQEAGTLSPEFLRFHAQEKWNGVLPPNAVPFFNLNPGQ
ncbi:MAG: prohibitin family protein [bacterium]|nr:prohibitin family protein [bacterium]